MATKPANYKDEKPSPASLETILESIVSFFTPQSSREAFQEDMREFRETTPGNIRYVKKAALSLSRIIPGKTLLAFSVPLAAADAFALCLSFAGAPASYALLAGFIVVLVVLRLRDAHTYPCETAPEAFLDAVISTTCLVATLILIAAISSSPILTTRDMLRGLLSSLAILALLRMIFRRTDPNKEYEPRELAVQSYEMATWLNAIWACAWVALMWTDLPVPYHLNFFFGFMPYLIVFRSYRSRQEGIGFPKKDEIPVSVVLGNNERAELMRKLNLLWLPKGIVDEVLFFAVIALQFATSVLASPVVDRFRLGANFTASVMLLIVWGYIRRANRAAGRLVQAELDKLAAAEARTV
jgi:hypothetical protein